MYLSRLKKSVTTHQSETHKSSSNSSHSSSSASSGSSNSVQASPSAGGTEHFANCTELRKKYPHGVPSTHPAYTSKMDRIMTTLHVRRINPF
ncbi:excalibur calcium-binding domain-containing protein [Bacillus velezensis]|nr:excalibur calcium-binding domain-containing protein [Bacillus velezensis]